MTHVGKSSQSQKGSGSLVFDENSVGINRLQLHPVLAASAENQSAPYLIVILISSLLY